MKLAIISDIHSNFEAITSVLRDIDQQSIDTIICTGDIVGYFTKPNEVIDLIRTRKIMTIQGNHDETIGKGYRLREEDIAKYTIEELHAAASRIYTNQNISESNRRYLRELPKQLLLEFNQVKVLCVHGSPLSNKEYMYDNEEILQKFIEVDADVIISGHTHLPYHHQIGDKIFINAGSVGKPKDGPQAKYVVLQIDEDGNVSSTVMQVNYSYDTLISDILNNDMISDQLADNIKYGK